MLSKQSSCSKCKKNHCCINNPRKAYVTVNIDEAIKIKKRTGLNYSDFLTFSKLPKRIVKASFNDSPGTEAKLRASMMMDCRILRLKTKRNHHCIFLDKNHCAIYSIRPSICKMYPFWIKNNKIAVHDGCSHCLLIDKDFVYSKLTASEIRRLKLLGKKIIKQSNYYKKNIISFVRTNNIVS